MKCKKCGKPLGAEDRLLSALFGGSPDLCSACEEEEQKPKCVECGQVSVLALNNKAYCLQCAGNLYSEIGKETSGKRESKGN